MKCNQLKNLSGLRELNLKHNNFSGIFIKCLQNCLKFDSYLKMIDLTHNNFSKKDLESFIETNCLIENASLLSFDIRFNPASSQSSSLLDKKISLSLLKNISTMKDNGTKINTKYLKKCTLYHEEIP
jgi:hypothetical protein